MKENVEKLACGLCAGWGPVCPRCLDDLGPPPPQVTVGAGVTVAGAFAYAGRAAAAVRDMKYSASRARVWGLAVAMADRIPEPAATSVTWVPSDRGNVRTRGFDPAELLARSVARCWGIPARRLIRRRAGPPQTGRDRAHRLLGPHLEPAPARIRGRPASVLIIDDVCTTGATITRAADALADMGIAVVGAGVLALNL